MIAEQTYLTPNTIDQALAYGLENEGNFKYLAGGTDIMANRFHGNETSPCLIDISQISDLKEHTVTSDYLRIGSLVKLDDLKKISGIRERFPVMLEAALAVGSPIIRKSATLGGNLLCENRCLFYNQSEWWRESIGACLKCGGEICIATKGKNACFSEIVSDMAPYLISIDAELEIVGSNGIQRITLDNLYTGDGVHPRSIDDKSIITSILIPLNRGFKSVFKKLRQRQSLEFTSLTTAVSVDKSNQVKIALGGVDPKVVVVNGSAESDKQELIKKSIKGARAVDNDMFSRNYRRQMIKVYLENSFDAFGL